MKNEKVSEKLEAIITDFSLQDSTAVLGEIILDTTLDDSTLREIPIIGTLLGLKRAVVSIRDRMFMNKLRYMLSEIESVPAEQRQKMIHDLSRSPDIAVSVGEKLLYIIDRCQDHESSRLIGKLFRAFLENSIEYNDFVRLAVCVDKLMPEDIAEFVAKDWKYIPIWEATKFVGTGLVTYDELEITVRDEDDPDRLRSGHCDFYVVEGTTQTVSATELGKCLKNILAPEEMKSEQ